MSWLLQTQEIDRLPKLCWIADLNLTQRTAKILHGPRVEVGTDFVVEGVWDRSFADGDFDRSANFFGSGIRVRGDELWLVPSRALVDRVLFGIQPGRAVAIQQPGRAAGVFRRPTRSCP